MDSYNISSSESKDPYEEYMRVYNNFSTSNNHSTLLSLTSSSTKKKISEVKQFYMKNLSSNVSSSSNSIDKNSLRSKNSLNSLSSYKVLLERRNTTPSPEHELFSSDITTSMRSFIIPNNKNLGEAQLMKRNENLEQSELLSDKDFIHIEKELDNEMNDHLFSSSKDKIIDVHDIEEDIDEIGIVLKGKIIKEDEILNMYISNDEDENNDLNILKITNDISNTNYINKYNKNEKMEVEKKKDNNIKEEEKENNNGELYEKRINPIWSSIDDDDDDDVWSATLHKRLKSLERPKKKDEKTKFSSLDRVRSIFKSDHVSVSSNSNCSNSNSSSYSTLINVGQELDNYSLPSSHVETPKNSFTSISNSKKLNSYEHKKSSSLENNVIINDLSIENPHRSKNHSKISKYNMSDKLSNSAIPSYNNKSFHRSVNHDSNHSIPDNRILKVPPRTTPVRNSHSTPNLKSIMKAHANLHSKYKNHTKLNVESISKSTEKSKFKSESDKNIIKNSDSNSKKNIEIENSHSNETEKMKKESISENNIKEIIIDNVTISTNISKENHSPETSDENIGDNSLSSEDLIEGITKEITHRSKHSSDKNSLEQDLNCHSESSLVLSNINSSFYHPETLTLQPFHIGKDKSYFPQNENLLLLSETEFLSSSSESNSGVEDSLREIKTKSSSISPINSNDYNHHPQLTFNSLASIFTKSEPKKLISDNTVFKASLAGRLEEGSYLNYLNNDSVNSREEEIMNISYLDDIHIFDELDSKRNILFDNHNKHSSNGEHSKILIAGTVYKLIQYLTSTIDYGFVIDFLLTYRFFLTSYQLGRLLITRYRWALTGEETQEKKKVRIRLFVVLRKWITQFWDVDFKNNKDLVDLILIFMKDINHLPFIQDSIYDKKINDTLYYLIIEKCSNINNIGKENFSYHSNASLPVIEAKNPKRSSLTRNDSNNDNETNSSNVNNEENLKRITNIPSKSSLRNKEIIYKDLNKMNINNETFIPIHNVGVFDNHINNRSSKYYLYNSDDISSDNDSTSLTELSSAFIYYDNDDIKHRSWKKIMSSKVSSFKRKAYSVLSGTEDNGNEFNFESEYGIQSENENGENRLTRANFRKSFNYNIDVYEDIQSDWTSNRKEVTSFSFETVNDNNIEYNGSSSKIHTQSKGSSGNILRKNSLFQHISGKNSGSKSFVLAIRSEDFAQQCCLIEQVLLRRVHWTELLNIENWTKIKENKEKKNLSILSMGKKGKNKNNDTSIIINSKGQDKNNDNELGITCIIERFNDVSHWVASEILRTSSIELRAKLIGKFIRIAQKCYHMNNYCTLNQIIYGLQNTYVERLKRTWTKVSNNEKNIYKKLVEFTNPFSNFKHVREAMEKFTENEVYFWNNTNNTLNYDDYYNFFMQSSSTSNTNKGLSRISQASSSQPSSCGSLNRQKSFVSVTSNKTNSTVFSNTASYLSINNNSNQTNESNSNYISDDTIGENNINTSYTLNEKDIIDIKKTLSTHTTSTMNTSDTSNTTSSNINLINNEINVNVNINNHNLNTNSTININTSVASNDVTLNVTVNNEIESNDINLSSTNKPPILAKSIHRNSHSVSSLSSLAIDTKGNKFSNVSCNTGNEPIKEINSVTLNSNNSLFSPFEIVDKDSIGAIPFTGIFLSDLVHLSELPSFLKGSKRHKNRRSEKNKNSPHLETKRSNGSLSTILSSDTNSLSLSNKHSNSSITSSIITTSPISSPSILNYHSNKSDSNIYSSSLPSKKNRNGSSSSKISTSKFSSKSSSKEPEHPNGYSLVNFQKFRLIAQMIRKFISFQSPNHMYTYEYIPSIFQKCQYLYILEDDIMKELLSIFRSERSKSRGRHQLREEDAENKYYVRSLSEGSSLINSKEKVDASSSTNNLSNSVINSINNNNNSNYKNNVESISSIKHVRSKSLGAILQKHQHYRDNSMESANSYGIVNSTKYGHHYNLSKDLNTLNQNQSSSSIVNNSSLSFSSTNSIINSNKKPSSSTNTSVYRNSVESDFKISEEELSHILGFRLPSSFIKKSSLEQDINNSNKDNDTNHSSNIDNSVVNKSTVNTTNPIITNNTNVDTYTIKSIDNSINQKHNSQQPNISLLNLESSSSMNNTSIKNNKNDSNIELVYSNDDIDENIRNDAILTIKNSIAELSNNDPIDEKRNSTGTTMTSSNSLNMFNPNQNINTIGNTNSSLNLTNSFIETMPNINDSKFNVKNSNRINSLVNVNFNTNTNFSSSNTTYSANNPFAFLANPNACLNINANANVPIMPSSTTDNSASSLINQASAQLQFTNLINYQELVQLQRQQQQQQQQLQYNSKLISNLKILQQKYHQLKQQQLHKVTNLSNYNNNSNNNSKTTMNIDSDVSNNNLNYQTLDSNNDFITPVVNFNQFHYYSRLNDQNQFAILPNNNIIQQQQQQQMNKLLNTNITTTNNYNNPSSFSKPF
ncbi:hypothetical protein H8356DRAFT_1089560 [Neocallimastix lanati (nom. inval.)]|nr:hypothetical protein H8356DRAFT_1089560 [Neocallimastix sp. JGI-2020a]